MIEKLFKNRQKKISQVEIYKLGIVKKYILLLIITSLLCLLPSNLFACYYYNIVPERSFVQFRIETKGNSWLYGRFEDMSGEFLYDDCNPKVDTYLLRIHTPSITSSPDKFVRLFRSRDFFDVERSPLVTFASKWYGENIARGIVDGTLAMNGVKKKISLHISEDKEEYVHGKGLRLTLTGKAVVNLKEFGIKNDIISNKGTMELNIRMVGINW